MSKLTTQQRRHAIVQQLQAQNEVSVEALSAQFQTSEVTIRKDLRALEESGMLLRRYGGAVRIPLEWSDASSEQDGDLKQRIAKCAASCVRDHHRILLDSGSTTGALIKALNHQGLVVMTNSLNLARELTELECEPTVLMTGGTWDARSDSFQGKIAEQVLRSYDFDQLFIGADGLDLARGTTTFNELLGLSQVMAEVAREVIVMIESQKIGRKMPNVELDWSKISCVVTDSGISAEAARAIEAHGVRLLIAS